MGIRLHCEVNLTFLATAVFGSSAIMRVGYTGSSAVMSERGRGSCALGHHVTDCTGVFAIGSRLELFELSLVKCSICIRSSLQAVTVEHDLITPHQRRARPRLVGSGT